MVKPSVWSIKLYNLLSESIELKISNLLNVVCKIFRINALLKINYFETYQEILQFDFPQNIQVICPSPKITDAFRQATSSRYEVITIARWIGSFDNVGKRVSKSELILRFSSAWRNYFPDASENLFNNAFELFTELRSFTLSLETIQNIIEPLDKDIQRSILIFWAVVTSENLIDEHLAYELKRNSFNEKRPVLFFGFKFLSAVQIDLLKQIARDVDVLIFFPKFVKAKAINTDWINWLDTTEIKSNVANNKTNLKVIEYTGGKLNSYLKKFFDSENVSSLCFLGGSDYLNSQEVLVKNYYFKEPINIFKLEFEEFFNSISFDNRIDLIELAKQCELVEVNCIIHQDFRKLKVMQLFKEALEIYSNYSNVLDSFSLKILKQAVKLNLPRNFIIPVAENNDKRVLNLDDLKFISESEPIVVVLSKLNSPFERKETSYNSQIVDKLKTVGPLMRGSFDVLLNYFELRNILIRNNVTLFLEEGLEENDSNVRDLLKNFKIEKIDNHPDFELKKLMDLFRENINLNKIKESKSISASKLQTYYDCPRKFFINYVEKIDLRLSSKSGMGPDDKGIIEHLVIGKYFKNHNQINNESLLLFCQNEIKHYSLNKKIVLSKKQYNEVLYEIVEYAINGLDYLYQLKKNNPTCEIFFEYPIPKNDFKLEGSIDCVIKNGENVSIIDFKRSEASIGSKQSFESFDKLQLWIYGLMLSNNFNVVKIGYLNISEPNEILEVDFLPRKDSFLSKFEPLVDSINREKNFDAIPRDKNVCEFCLIKNLCTKGNAHE